MTWTVSSNPVGKSCRRLVGLLAAMGVLLLMAWTPFAHAAGTDSAIAEALFQEGKDLMKQGKYGEACPKLAESNRLDPASGTALALAMCHEKDGKTASAWTAYLEAAALAKKDGSAKRERAAKKRAAALKPKLSWLTIVIAEEVQSLDGVRIRFDDVTLERAVWGTDMPVDPGEHVVEATAPGKNPWTGRVAVEAAGDRQQIEIGALEDAPVVEEPEDGQPEAPTAPKPDQAPDTGLTGGQVAGYVIGAVGLVGLGFGTFFGIQAIDKVGKAQVRCTPEHCTDPEAIELNEDGAVAADVSTVAFAVGGAAVVTGLILVLVTGSDESSEAVEPEDSGSNLRVVPAVGWQAAGLTIGGAW